MSCTFEAWIKGIDLNLFFRSNFSAGWPMFMLETESMILGKGLRPTNYNGINSLSLQVNYSGKESSDISLIIYEWSWFCNFKILWHKLLFLFINLGRKVEKLIARLPESINVDLIGLRLHIFPQVYTIISYCSSDFPDDEYYPTTIK